MAVHTIKKGLDLPISGLPGPTIRAAAGVTRVALLAVDYVGMKPTMFVKPGDAVRRGQAVFEDKKDPGVMFTSPAAGTVLAVNRGERRAFQSVVIELSDGERKGSPASDEFANFEHHTAKDPKSLDAVQVRALLIESGQWTAFRTRPMSKVPAVDSTPPAIFVTAMDTNPLAPPMDTLYAENKDAFETGLRAVSKLTAGPTYLCRAQGSAISANSQSEVRVEEFAGAHPAGNAGTHIHILEGAARSHVVWHIGLQDVIAIGHLFKTGRLHVDRIIALAGPQVSKPQLLRTRIGASTDLLTAGELKEGENRVISGSVLSGRAARGDVFGYLGRYHQQISVVREGREREFLGWLTPGGDRFSVTRAFLSGLFRGRRFDFTTSTMGSPRAMVPIGLYEKVMPLDILPSYLLRALIMGDVERAEQLGCLELDEEDLALCSFVCPGKTEYGPLLRAVLTQIEREG